MNIRHTIQDSTTGHGYTVTRLTLSEQRQSIDVKNVFNVFYFVNVFYFKKRSLKIP